MVKRVKKVLVAAGGLGTRFLPISSTLAKEMFPLIDKPVIQYVLEECLVNGIEELILVISKEKKVLLDYLKNSKDIEFQKLLKRVKITFLYRKDSFPLGNGIPLLDFKKHIKDGPFLVLWGDSFGLRKHRRIEKMLKLYSKLQRPIICFIPFFERARFLYAIPEIKQVSKNLLIIKRIFEKPGKKKIASPYAFGNGYLMEPDLFPYLERLKPNKKGEIVLEDAIDSYCQNNLVYGMVFREPLFEAGNKIDYIKSSLRLLLYKKELKKYYPQILEELKEEAGFRNK